MTDNRNSFSERHPYPLTDPREWWACSEPERPPETWMLYSEHCRWCVAKAVIDLATDTGLARNYRGADGEVQPMTLTAWLGMVAANA